MSKVIRLSVILVMLMALIPVSTVKADVVPPNPNCVPFNNPSNPIEVYLICVPAVNWNGDLVVFAHGYMDPRRPVDIPYDQLLLSDGTTIPGLVNSLNFAFATTSYRKNGLAVVEGVQDVLGLIAFFKQAFPTTNQVFLVGASEGGLVTTLITEKYPSSINGGLALCGPIGDFVKQVDYWDDFRVVFDYFFPDTLAPTAINIPPSLPDQWSTYTSVVIEPFPPVPVEIPGPLQNSVIVALQTAPAAKISQLLRVTKAPISILDPQKSTLNTVLTLLWYNLMSTNDGRVELNHGPYTGNQGNPYDNIHHIYTGSANDKFLNAKVKRFAASPAALKEITRNYQTSGNLTIPLVTMHTTGDPVVPFWHEGLYFLKVLFNKTNPKSYKNLTNITIARYGHCSFYAEELLLAFNRLLGNAGGTTMNTYLSALPNQASQERFKKLVTDLGSSTSVSVNDK